MPSACLGIGDIGSRQRLANRLYEGALPVRHRADNLIAYGQGASCLGESVAAVEVNPNRS